MVLCYGKTDEAFVCKGRYGHEYLCENAAVIKMSSMFIINNYKKINIMQTFFMAKDLNPT